MQKSSEISFIFCVLVSLWIKIRIFKISILVFIFLWIIKFFYKFSENLISHFLFSNFRIGIGDSYKISSKKNPSI